jgi:hypothetical protein
MIGCKPFIIVVFLPFLVACVSLSEVHNYASSSVDALHKVNATVYTFQDYCKQDCELQQLRKGEISPAFICSCQEPAANADSAIQKIHFTITAYLQAVAQLSNNKSFTYDVSGLTGAVEKSSLLRLNDDQVSVATKAGNFIATAATSYYRRKKLKQYLDEADTVFRDLTETFIYLIDNRLRAQLKFEYDARVPNIRQMLENTSDKAMKQLLVKQFLDEKAYFNKQNAMIDLYVTALRSVQRGYHELYLHRDQLKDVNTRKILNRYAQDLLYLVQSVK